MSTKQISIDLSSLSSHSHSHKTRKNARPKEKPIISPNVLKNKLLNRIKEHKKRESNSLTSSNNNNNKSTDILAYSDEFNESMDYLENLSKQTQKEKKREELYRQTLKNHTATTPVLNVYNDLPEDLIDMNKAFVSSVYPTLSLDPVPYGILKNGSKPTFREWKKTQKNVSSLSTLTPSPMNDREKRMADLKTKFASLTATTATTIPTETSAPIIVETTATSPLSNETIAPIITETSLATSSLISPINTMPYTNTSVKSSTSSEKPSSYTSKKYTLGKKHNIVGVLLKDNKTRKNVMTAQQNLKKKTISQIKEYLKDHNLIKVGSTAPTDVLKEMYVSAMLTGDVTNSNQDILLHNFLKSEENK